MENYLINPLTLQRIIQSRIAKRTTPPTVEEITNRITEITLEMEDGVFDAISSELLIQNRGWNVSKSNKEARKIIAEVKEAEGGILSIVSGKELISNFSRWSQQEFGVSVSAISVAKMMQVNEIADEMKKVVNAIETCEELS